MEEPQIISSILTLVRNMRTYKANLEAADDLPDEVRKAYVGTLTQSPIWFYFKTPAGEEFYVNAKIGGYETAEGEPIPPAMYNECRKLCMHGGNAKQAILKLLPPGSKPVARNHPIRQGLDAFVRRYGGEYAKPHSAAVVYEVDLSSRLDRLKRKSLAANEQQVIDSIVALASTIKLSDAARAELARRLSTVA